MKDRILLVEDDAALGEQVVGNLQKAGFDPDWIRDGDAARSINPAAYRLIILDLMLPGTYGLDLLNIYRAKSEVPVLILSARDDTADKVRGLKLGADDYLTKPFFPEELLARASACLRRPNMVPSERVSVGSLTIDLARREVQSRDGRIDLTAVEFDILAALARRKGSAVTRDALVALALDPEREGTRRTLDVHVSRLRKKLGESGRCVETVWGIGYRLVDAP